MRPPKQHTCAIVCSDQEPGSERERERESKWARDGRRAGGRVRGGGGEGGREQKQQGGRGEFERGAPRNLVKRAWCGVPSPWCLAVKVSGIYPNVQARPAVRRYMNQFQPNTMPNRISGQFPLTPVFASTCASCGALSMVNTSS